VPQVPANGSTESRGETSPHLGSEGASETWRPATGYGWAPWTGALVGVVGTVLVALLWARGAAVDLPWLTIFPSRLVVTFDDLGGPVALFSTILLFPILVYAAGYLPDRFGEHGVSSRVKVRFTLLMVGFGIAMVLLATAGDLLILFVALELTAIASFLLIGLEHDEEAHRSAMVALVVTVGSSLLFLIGAFMVADELGTLQTAPLRELVAAGQSPSVLAVACLAAGVLGKSAQMPLHFWLPRAMVAPTPVSAYLHSATLVAAGVFVLTRLRFLVATSPEVLTGLAVVGFVSTFAGGAMALTRDGLKGILAYSTIAQFGYAVVLVALGGKYGTFGAPFFLVAHGVPKCALFMVAGCVTHMSGAKGLRDAAGVLRHHPPLAVAAGVAAAGLAGFPLTVGFFKDEVLFGAATHDGPLMAALATAAAALTVGYTGRFWLGLVRGDGGPAADRRPLPASMTIPVFALAALAVLGGVWLAPLVGTFSDAGAVVAGHPVHVDLGYHLRAESGMAAVAWVLGGLILVLLPRFQRGAERVVDAIAQRVGPAVLAARLAGAVNAISDTAHRVERRDLRDRVAAVLLPLAALVALGLWGGEHRELVVGDVGFDDLPLVAGLVVSAAAAVAAARQVEHLSMVLVLSFVGFSLSLTLALEGAPDVALILVIVETVTTILFIAVLSKLRPQILERARTRAARGGRWVGWIAGATAFVVAWLALSSGGVDRVAWELVRLAPEAHGYDVVTVVLADFRGLDTAGEVTAFAVAVLGAAAIGWGRR